MSLSDLELLLFLSLSDLEEPEPVPLFFSVAFSVPFSVALVLLSVALSLKTVCCTPLEPADELLEGYITAAVSYAESYQHIAEGYYSENAIPATTEQVRRSRHVPLVSFYPLSEHRLPCRTETAISMLRSALPSRDLTDYKDAIMEAMYRGTKRNVESEPDSKNA